MMVKKWIRGMQEHMYYELSHPSVTLPNTPEPVGGFNRQALVGTPIEARERVGKFEFEFRH